MSRKQKKKDAREQSTRPVSYTHLLMSAVYTAQAAVNTTRTVVQAVAK